jgi:NADH-quinone oxidoreductase subunit H
MKVIGYLFSFLVFPGFLFAAAVGLIAGWVDRKVTARIQWRVGPPWYQNFMDVAKLFYKETIIPQGCSKSMFLGMPLVALVSATLVSTIILMVNLRPSRGFLGDFIVVLYLSVMPSIALMLGGFFSGNPLANLGSSREMKLILSYELPFLLASVVPVIKSGYSIRLGDIVRSQLSGGAFFSSPSGILAFVVGLLAIQAKLGFVPFDVAEAETEITCGPYIEYSGKALGMWKLAKAVLLVGLPALLVTVLFGGFGTNAQGLVKGVLKYIFILVLMILIKNTNPRVRIDQALRFFWRPVTGLAILSVLLATLGL